LLVMLLLVKVNLLQLKKWISLSRSLRIQSLLLKSIRSKNLLITWLLKTSPYREALIKLLWRLRMEMRLLRTCILLLMASTINYKKEI
jgi:hypothetical protein